MRRLFAAVAAIVIVSGCSGKSTGALPPGRSNDLIPATFVMHWPAMLTTQSLRRPQFISPSTKSVAIDINNDPSLTVVANNPSTGQATQTNVAFAAPPGNDTITFSLYDSADAKGNELGQVTVTQTIVPAQANSINATVGGLISSVELDPLPNQQTLSSATDSTGATSYSIAGDLPVTFAAKAKDADGNIIVGPGEPVSFGVTSTSSVLSIAPVSGQSNEFTVQVAGTPSNGASFGIVAHATDQLGNSSQSNYSVQLTALTYVAYQNTSTGAIAAFDKSGNHVALPGSFTGLSQPLGIASDPVNHRIYALDGATSTVLAFNTDGTVASGFTPPVVSGGTNVTFDSHTNQLFVTSSNNTVSVFNADGSAAQIAGTFPNLNGPVALTLYGVDPTFYVFAANAGNNTYTTYNEDGTPAAFGPMMHSSFSTGTLVPAGIAADSDSGQILISGNDTGASELQLFSLLGTPGATQNSGLSGPSGAIYNAFDGNYYVANRTSGTVTVFDSQIAGSVQTLVAPSGFSAPVGVAFVF